MKTKAGKKVLLTLVCAALTIALGACSGDKAGKESSQITIGIPQDVDSLDPHKAVAAGTKEVLFNVFEGLVKPDGRRKFKRCCSREPYHFGRWKSVYLHASRWGKIS